MNKEVKRTMKFAYAEGTFRNLRMQWDSFLLFCYKFKLNPFPVDVKTLSLYAQFLSRSFESVQSVHNYLSAIKTLHCLLDLKYPETNLMPLNMLLRGVARSKQHVPKKAAPITPQIFKEMFCFLDMRQEFDIVCWCAILLMFFLMARKSNLLPNSVNGFDSQKQLIRQDIEVLDDMLIVNIKWSKTRQYGHSRQMPVIAMPDHCLCPVAAYKAMVSTVVAKESDPAFCFHSLNKPNRLVPLTYAQFQAKLRELISCTGRLANLFSTHSIRRGSCSWAFKSRVKSELIQHHGDWVSECYKEYLTYDFHQKLSVSQKLCCRILNNS